MTASPLAVQAGASERASRGLWGDAFRRLMRNGPALVGLGLIAFFVSCAILAPVIAPYGPNTGSLSNFLQGPSPGHIMGTDKQGLDEYSRILYGAQISLTVGVVAVLFGLVGGTIVGAIAGGAGGLLDSVLMRITEAILRDQSTVLSVSSLVKGLYGIEDVYLSLPTVLHRGGVERVIHLELSEGEESRLKNSARVLQETIAGLDGTRPAPVIWSRDLSGTAHPWWSALLRRCQIGYPRTKRRAAL